MCICGQISNLLCKLLVMQFTCTIALLWQQNFCTFSLTSYFIIAGLNWTLNVFFQPWPIYCNNAFPHIRMCTVAQSTWWSRAECCTGCSQLAVKVTQHCHRFALFASWFITVSVFSVHSDGVTCSSRGMCCTKSRNTVGKDAVFAIETAFTKTQGTFWVYSHHAHVLRWQLQIQLQKLPK